MGKLYENKRKPKREDKKVTVGRIGDVPPGCGATVKLKDGSEVALFNVKGEFYAVEKFLSAQSISACRFASLRKHRRMRPSQLAFRCQERRVFDKEKLFNRILRSCD